MRFKLKFKKKNKKDSKIVAKLALFTKDGSILLLKRSNLSKKHKGEWDLPGGHIHEGEEIVDGLRREVKEEISVKVKDPKFVFNNKGKKDHFYVEEWSGTKIKLSKEHTSFILCEMDKLDQLKTLTNYYRDAIKQCYEVFKSEYN